MNYLPDFSRIGYFLYFILFMIISSLLKIKMSKIGGSQYKLLNRKIESFFENIYLYTYFFGGKFMKNVRFSWKVFLGGVLVGTIITLTFSKIFIYPNNNDSKTPKIAAQESTIQTQSVKQETTETQEREKGTLSNPFNIGESFTIKDLDAFNGGFDVNFKVLEFKDSSQLENFTPLFYGDTELKSDETYYAIKLSVSVEDAKNKDQTFQMDALNMVKLLVDGVQANNNIIDIHSSNYYNGIDGAMVVGSQKEGWIGIQAPTSAKQLLLDIGGYESDVYIKLK